MCFIQKHFFTLPLLAVGVAVGWFPNEIDGVSEAGTRVGPKFKFPPKLANEIPCKGVCFWDESNPCLSAILEKDTSENAVWSRAHKVITKYALRTYFSPILQYFDSFCFSPWKTLMSFGKQNRRRKIRLVATWPLNQLDQTWSKKIHRLHNYSAR